jgi:hypothetical protein
MRLSKKLKRENPNYVGSFKSSEVERMAEVFDMVRGMRTAINAKGYNAKSVVIPRMTGTRVDLYIEEEV